MDATTSSGQMPGALRFGGGGSGNEAFAAPRGYALSGKIMLSAIVILFSVVLFVLFLHLYARYYLLHRAASRRRRSQSLVFAAEGPVPAPPASLCGLDPEILKSIPVHSISYSAHGGETESEVSECAVCLNEFEEGEKVRTLPRCCHGFHVECIDMWFHSHATCPLCRSAVAAAPSPPIKPDAVVVPISEEPLAPPAAAQPTDLRASCRHENEGTSSSSRAVGLRVEVPARRPEGFIRRLDDEVGSPGGAFKSPGGRIIALKRLWSRDLRSYRGADLDLERGEGAERVPATPRTTSQ